MTERPDFLQSRFGVVFLAGRESIENRVSQAVARGTIQRVSSKNSLGGIADFSYLARVPPAVATHEQMELDSQPLSPAGSLFLVSSDRVGDFSTGQHAAQAPSHLVSRQSRSRLLTRWSITPRLVVETPRILQISSVDKPSTSRKRKAIR